jgi:coenzyme F420-reducing hydrogenase beta subunit
MIRLTEKANCCGCGACADICPKRCITMKQDEEGFFYPAVDPARCIDCGLCEGVCPILKKQAPQPVQLKAYAARATEDALREKSSSGGLFTLLAEEILSRGGCVAGAAFDQDLSVRHILGDNAADLEKLRGSKYVQSRMEDTYLCVKEQLQKGRLVLFTGVACQVAGLKSYLGKEYENLYTVDILCHGVPSPMVWEKYLREQEAAHGQKPAAVSFRDKRTGWRRSSISMKFDQGAEYCRPGGADRYMQLFLGDICLRPSCHSCRFKAFPRLSDLTIGDAWGIEKQMPQLDDDRGTSVILVNSEKGQKLFDRVASRLVCQQGEPDSLLPPDADSRRSVRPHANRAKFFAELEQGKNLEQLAVLTRKSGYRRLLSWGKRTLKRLLGK